MSKKVILIIIIVILLLAVGTMVAWWLWPRPASSSHKKASVVTYSTDKPNEKKPDDTYDWQGSARDPKKIAIPSIGVDAYLQNVGVDQKKEIAVPNNIHLGGWFVDSVRPGDKGLSIIDGHLNGRSLDGIFVQLERLKAGDTYTITFGDGQVKEFRVVKVATVPLKEAASVLFSQDPSITRQLNLVTCGGQWDKAARLYDKRVIVISEATT